MNDFDKFEDIPAWQESMELIRRVYEHTAEGPWLVDDVLRDELRSTAISIPTKIAKGYGLGEIMEFRKSVTSARGQIFVIKTLLYIAKDLEYLDEAGFDAINAAVESTLPLIDLLGDNLKRGAFRRSGNQ